MLIRWDSLLVRHTASELSRTLVDARLRAVRFDGHTRALALLFDDLTLEWSLHPQHGWLRLVAGVPAGSADLEVTGRVTAVEAPPDERILEIRLAARSGRDTRVVIELMGNQWNALVVEGDPPVIRHVLWRRQGAHARTVGDPYHRPKPLGRIGADGAVAEQEWLALLGPLPESERAAALVRAFAWTSPLNAAALLGAPEAPGEPSGLELGYARWTLFADAASATEPVLLETDRGAQPYPFPLAGTPSTPRESLLRAFEVVATGEGGAAPAAALDPSLLADLDAALRRAAGRTQRLELELAELPDPVALRALADLILARYADIPHGAERALLTAFDGSSVEVTLDPAQPPHANAARYYRDATKSERAAERLPALLEKARASHARMRDLVARAKAGTVGPEEARTAIGDHVRRPQTLPSRPEPTLPYRVFRSSGGLEIRVGRGARHNDELTFRHSSPGDVWLHARHVGGAHVILRWTGPGNPPARDLAEAATLAALHSKARTSGSVPVDWTLRKYVRKPRKSPPGRVAVERVQTLFVRPEPALLQALAEPRDGDAAPYSKS
jgi:predicted ribosome quality control (RQC) complex YloA/Tae2 family protein